MTVISQELGANNEHTSEFKLWPYKSYIYESSVNSVRLQYTLNINQMNHKLLSVPTARAFIHLLYYYYCGSK